MTAASRFDGHKWWTEPFRLLQTNLREEDALLDAEATVDQFIELGYDTWLCNAGGIVYYYPVDQPYQRESSLLRQRGSGDMVGDVLTAVRQRGARLMSRFDFSRLPSDILEENPDWAFVDTDGNWYSEDGLTAICPRSDYHEHLVPEILQDFVERYPVDGIFFNWLQYPEVSYSGLYKGVCQCDRCRAAFQAAHPDAEHPRRIGDPTYAQWADVALSRLTELAERYSNVVNEIRPGTPFMLADVRMDIAFLEINSSLGHGSEGWWHHTPSEIASVNRISDPGVPALVHSSVNIGLPYRQVAEEPTQFVRYIAQALSRGALPSTVVVGQVDVGRFPCITAGRDLMSFLERHRSLYAAYAPTSRVALFRPRGGTALNAMQFPADFSEYRGVYTALQEAHVPFDVLGLQFQEQLARDDVASRYDVVIVPGAANLDEPLRRSLDAFVEQGGSLVLTGDVSNGADPVFESDPAAARVRRLTEPAELGGRYVGPADGSVDRPLHPVLGHFDLVALREGSSTGELALSSQSPNGPPERTGGNSAVDGAPAVLRAKRGRGSVTRFPWAIGLTSYRSGLTALDRVISDEVRMLLGDLDVSAEFSSLIEITVGRSGESTVIHLVNHSGGRGDRVREPLPIRGTLVLRGDAADAARRGVRALVADADITVEETGGGVLRLSVPIEGVLEVVELG